VAASQGKDFAKAQHDFMIRTHYEPALKTAGELGFAVGDPRIQEAVFSTSVQHRKASTVLKMASDMASADGKDLRSMDAAEQVPYIYKARSAYVSGLSTVPEKTKESILKRYEREERDVSAIGAPTAPAAAMAQAPPAAAAAQAPPASAAAQAPPAMSQAQASPDEYMTSQAPPPPSQQSTGSPVPASTAQAQQGNLPGAPTAAAQASSSDSTQPTQPIASVPPPMQVAAAESFDVDEMGMTRVLIQPIIIRTSPVVNNVIAA